MNSVKTRNYRQFHIIKKINDYLNSINESSFVNMNGQCFGFSLLWMYAHAQSHFFASYTIDRTERDDLKWFAGSLDKLIELPRSSAVSAAEQVTDYDLLRFIQWVGLLQTYTHDRVPGGFNAFNFQQKSVLSLDDFQKFHFEFEIGYYFSESELHEVLSKIIMPMRYTLIMGRDHTIVVFFDGDTYELYDANNATLDRKTEDCKALLNWVSKSLYMKGKGYTYSPVNISTYHITDSQVEYPSSEELLSSCEYTSLLFADNPDDSALSYDDISHITGLIFENYWKSFRTLFFLLQRVCEKINNSTLMSLSSDTDTDFEQYRQEHYRQIQSSIINSLDSYFFEQMQTAQSCGDVEKYDRIHGEKRDYLTLIEDNNRRYPDQMITMTNNYLSLTGFSMSLADASNPVWKRIKNEYAKRFKTEEMLIQKGLEAAIQLRDLDFFLEHIPEFGNDTLKLYTRLLNHACELNTALFIVPIIHEIQIHKTVVEIDSIEIARIFAENLVRNRCGYFRESQLNEESICVFLNSGLFDIVPDRFDGYQLKPIKEFLRFELGQEYAKYILEKIGSEAEPLDNNKLQPEQKLESQFELDGAGNFSPEACQAIPLLSDTEIEIKLSHAIEFRHRLKINAWLNVLFDRAQRAPLLLSDSNWICVIQKLVLKSYFETIHFILIHFPHCGKLLRQDGSTKQIVFRTFKKSEKITEKDFEILAPYLGKDDFLLMVKRLAILNRTGVETTIQTELVNWIDEYIHLQTVEKSLAWLFEIDPHLNETIIEAIMNLNDKMIISLMSQCIRDLNQAFDYIALSIKKKCWSALVMCCEHLMVNYTPESLCSALNDDVIEKLIEYAVTSQYFPHIKKMVAFLEYIDAAHKCKSLSRHWCRVKSSESHMKKYLLSAMLSYAENPEKEMLYRDVFSLLQSIPLSENDPIYLKFIPAIQHIADNYSAIPKPSQYKFANKLSEFVESSYKQFHPEFFQTLLAVCQQSGIPLNSLKGFLYYLSDKPALCVIKIIFPYLKEQLLKSNQHSTFLATFRKTCKLIFYSQNTPLILELLKHGLVDLIDINSINGSGMTLLHIATLDCDRTLIEYCLENAQNWGLDINACTHSATRTALHLVATSEAQDKESLMSILIRAGLDPEIVDVFGNTAFSYIGGELNPRQCTR